MTGSERRKVIILLGSLSAVGPFSVDMYLPGFAAIARDLSTSVASVGYSLTSYFIGISLGQLIYGPLTDRFGRKPPLMAGLGIYLAATLACLLSPSITWLVLARLVMALGACVGMVISRAVVRDLFPVRESASIFSTLILVIAVSPILAPSVGGYVTSNFGWRVIFLILGIFSFALAVVVWIGLPESKSADRGVSLRIGDIAKRYYQVARKPTFGRYAVASGLASGGMFAYIAGAPYTFMTVLGLSQTQFGWAFALNAAGLIAGSQINRLALRRFDALRIARFCVGVQVGAGLCLTAAVATGTASLPVMYLLLITFMFCAGMANPDTTALALEPFSENIGSASALLGSVQMVTAALATGAVSLLAEVFSGGGSLPMTITILLCSSLSLLLLSRRTTLLHSDASMARVS
ncbi:MAG TPA: multidrug effflux MFS transporter [Spirochaetia bacterium]|nr:multidrug effflux MFS transporter [Spirochaetia bacterium]